MFGMRNIGVKVSANFGHQRLDSSYMESLSSKLPHFRNTPVAIVQSSSAASIVLTNLFGDDFAFHDDSDKEYIGMERSFNSFYDAAEEASISRLYGGIHYRFGIDAGIIQGKQVGEFLVKKLQLTDSTSQIADK